MPKHTELKLEVPSFDRILEKLEELGAESAGASESDHYYGDQPGDDVTKLVISNTKCEIHILKEEGGTFTLTDRVPVDGKNEGLEWLHENGFAKTTHINMKHDDFEYAGGIVGLYTINDGLLSVILDFPKSQHETMRTLFGLQESPVIEQPFNKYLLK